MQLWCSRLAFSFGVILSSSFLYFAFLYPNRTRIKPAMEIAISVITAALVYLTLSPWAIKGSIRIVDGTITGDRGPLMPFFSLYLPAFIFLSLVILIWKFLKYRGVIRVRIWYTAIGFAFFAIPGIVTNLILPTFFHNFRYNNLGPIFSLPMVAIIAYVIIRHRFMGIRQAVARLVTYVFLIVFLGAAYAASMSLISSFLIKGLSAESSLWISMVFAIAIAFSFQPLRDFFERLTNRIFYQHHYDENRLLYALALIMSSSSRLNDLSEKLLHKILDDMHISCGALILSDGKKIIHLSQEGYKCQPEFSPADLREMTGLPDIAVYEELAEGRLKQIMRKFEMRVIIPLRTRKKRDNILVLGEKLSGDPYSSQDIRLFEVFAPTAAVAVANTVSVEQLIQLDDLKSEFITVVSHQLRTPLSVARWNFELLLEGAFGKLAPKVKNISKDTYKALMELNRGLNNLMLALEIEERKVVLKYDATDFNQEIIGEALSSLEKEIAEKDIKISKKLDFSGALILDRHKVLETVESLLANAIEYSPAGSRVDMSTMVREENGRREFVFSIRDQGIGVPADHRDFIFQRFFRGEEAKKMSPNGFGLSLFIAKSFILLHGGRIWLEDKKAGAASGAEFCFSLPIKSERPGKA